MRVIAGKYRGKKLKEFSLDTTKPTLDRVKESVFSSIQFNLIGAVVLDLFSGTGALGIESVSRGASKVDFVDNNPEAIKIIKQNLSGIEGDFSVEKMDYLSFLNMAKVNSRKYDVVLLDPPFATDYGLKAIDYILRNNMLTKNGVVIYERLYTPDFVLDYPNIKYQQRKYGTVGVVKITMA